MSLSFIAVQRSDRRGGLPVFEGGIDPGAETALVTEELLDGLDVRNIHETSCERMAQDVRVDGAGKSLHRCGAYDPFHLAFGKRTVGLDRVKGRMVTGHGEHGPEVKVHKADGIGKSLGKRDVALRAVIRGTGGHVDALDRTVVEPQVAPGELHELTDAQACIEHYQGKCVIADTPVLLLGCSILAGQGTEETAALFGG